MSNHSAPGSSALPFVYINNEVVELLEDRRLCLFPKYPEDTVLMDPSFYPPRAVPMSPLPEEHGITARKLLPQGHYHAFVLDPTTGERIPANIQRKFLVVHNLPSTATAEFLGKFFEQFDYILEADIVKAPRNPSMCKGRGFVQFATPEMVHSLLSQVRTVPMMPNVVAWLDYSDVKPKGCSLPPPQYSQTHPTGTPASAPGSVGGAGPTTASNDPQSSFVDTRLGSLPSPSHHHNSSHHHHHHHHSTTNPPLHRAVAPAAPAAVATCTNHFYFVTQIYEEHIQTSIRDGIFWPTKNNQRTFYAALERGPVYMIFHVTQRPLLFGYARLTPRDMARNRHANFTLDWVKHSVYLTEDELRVPFPAVQILNFVDGTSLKPELGQAICEHLDRCPERTMPPPAVSPTHHPASATGSPMAHGAPHNSSSGSGYVPRRASAPVTDGSVSSSSGTPSTPTVPQPRSAREGSSGGSPTAYGAPSPVTHAAPPPPPSIHTPTSPNLGSPPHMQHHHHHHHHHPHMHHHHHHHHHHNPHLHRPVGAAPPVASSVLRTGPNAASSYAAPPPPPPPPAAMPMRYTR